MPRPRTPFVLLVLAMLGAAMVFLLVINTTLSASSLEINRLQQAVIARTRQEQALRQQVATEDAPAAIARRARKLGMRPEQALSFLDLRTGRIYTQPATVPGVVPVPGWTP